MCVCVCVCVSECVCVCGCECVCICGCGKKYEGPFLTCQLSPEPLLARFSSIDSIGPKNQSAQSGLIS